MCCNQQQSKEGLITPVSAFIYKLCTASESTNHTVRLEMSLQFLDLYVCTVKHLVSLISVLLFTYNLQVLWTAVGR